MGFSFTRLPRRGKASGFKYLCRSDRVDYSLGFIYGSASEARLYGVLIKELIDKKAYLGIFCGAAEAASENLYNRSNAARTASHPLAPPDLLLRSKVNTLKPAFG